LVSKELLGYDHKKAEYMKAATTEEHYPEMAYN